MCRDGGHESLVLMASDLLFTYAENEPEGVGSWGTVEQQGHIFECLIHR